MNGRKQKSNTDKRKHPVSCRLTDQELSQVDSLRGGMTRGEFLRRAAMDKELPSPVPEVNKEAWLELSKLHGNFNQIAKQLNTFGALNNPNELPEIIQDLRLALLGVKQSVVPTTPQKQEKLQTIQDRHYELRLNGCNEDEIQKRMTQELDKILMQIGFSESKFYGWDERVLNELWAWCEWTIDALQEVERDKRIANEWDGDYEITSESHEDSDWDE